MLPQTLEMNQSPRVYLAGPGVFRRDAISYGTALKSRCRSLGLEPLWPLDNQPTAIDAAEIARQIRQMNCAMIASADAVVADISPFRGPNMDPGTAFEIGFAVALLKPIWLYSESPASLLQRTCATHDIFPHDGKMFDANAMEIEDFGLRENLMIAAAADHIYPHSDDALAAAARHLTL